MRNLAVIIFGIISTFGSAFADDSVSLNCKFVHPHTRAVVELVNPFGKQIELESCMEVRFYNFDDELVAQDYVEFKVEVEANQSRQIWSKVLNAQLQNTYCVAEFVD
jgi:hypothetical protein